MHSAAIAERVPAEPEGDDAVDNDPTDDDAGQGESEPDGDPDSQN